MVYDIAGYNVGCITFTSKDNRYARISSNLAKYFSQHFFPSPIFFLPFDRHGTWNKRVH